LRAIGHEEHANQHKNQNYDCNEYSEETHPHVTQP
jgi:hypothetical protein